VVAILVFSCSAAPAAAGDLTVTPSTGLARSGQNVTVSGTGLAPFEEIGFDQCRRSPAVGKCIGRGGMEADGSGNFSGQIFVSYSSSAFLSCEDAYCEIEASPDQTPRSSYPSVPISFDGSTSTTSTPSPGSLGSIAFGEPVTDTAVVTGDASRGSPTGSMSFFVCGPDGGHTCYEGGSAVPGNPRPLVAGPDNTATSTSGEFTPPAPGRWCFRSEYSGSLSYGPSYDSNHEAECFFSKAQSTTTASMPPWVPIWPGGSALNTAVVAGTPLGGAPTGFVQFYLCSQIEAPATCDVGSFHTSNPLEPGPDNTSSARAGGAWLSPGRYCFRSVYTGSNRYFGSSASGQSQCVVVGGYPRPISASPIRVSVVPAYTQCSDPNASHGPPLSFGACIPPDQASNELTVGTHDANDQPPQSVGYVRVRTLVGDPSTDADEADVAVTVSLTDVRARSDLSDYTGELEADLALRITDKFTPVPPYGDGPATLEDIRFVVPVSCAMTDPGIGATCSTDTTADAVIPGMVRERGRSVWALGPIKINDGGPDGAADTPAGNTLFATQGLFVP
jgi:hypothetical protein